MEVPVRYLSTVCMLLLAACVSVIPPQPVVTESEPVLPRAKLFEEVKKAVRIEITGKTVAGPYFSSGTGIPYQSAVVEDHYVTRLLTARHLFPKLKLKEYPNIKLIFYGLDSNSILKTLEGGKLVQTHPSLDVAIIEIISKIAIPVCELSKHEPQIGEDVWAIGFPSDMATTVSDGFVYRQDSPGRWACNAAVSFGMSGGPIISENTGKVIGIVSETYVYRYGVNNGLFTYVTELCLPQIDRFVAVSAIKDWAESPKRITVK